MKYIPLTKDKRALVDDDDYTSLSANRWHYSGDGYAARWTTAGLKKRKLLLMHRLIMGEPRALEVDHVNGDTLDNRKANLRVVSHRENTINTPAVRRNSTTGIRGVSKSTRWVAHIGVNGKKIVLGSFSTMEKAVEARKLAEQKYFGEFLRF